jgi:hypothetical protein
MRPGNVRRDTMNTTGRIAAVAVPAADGDEAGDGNVNRVTAGMVG